MIEKGSRVRATRRWGYGQDIKVGRIDRDYLEGYDSNATLTIWLEDGNYLAVIIDARYWKVEKLDEPLRPNLPRSELAPRKLRGTGCEVPPRARGTSGAD